MEDRLKKMSKSITYKNIQLFRITVTFWAAVMLIFIVSCSSEKTKTAPPINEKDSIAFMQSRGIATLISDSGVIRYKIIAEEWNIYNNTNPPKWTFMKGILLEKFDQTYHTDWFVQADTAYCHNQKLWELRGRVVIRNQQGTLFRTEELFWDMTEHEIYSTLFMQVSTPDRELEGYNFRSNEQMTRYIIYNSKGAIPVNESVASNDSITRTSPTKPQ